MGAIDVGGQKITLKFLDPANTVELNLIPLGIIPVGIWSGADVTIVQANPPIVQVSPMLIEISDGTYQVRISFTLNATVNLDSTTPYVVLRWVYVPGATANYADFVAVALGSIQANDIVICKGVFSGPSLTGIDLSPRTTPKSFDIFLRAEPTSPASMKVKVRPGRSNYGTVNLEVIEQLSPLIVAPVTSNRIDVLYLDTDGTLKIFTGSEGPSPLPPDYANKIVLAEIGPLTPATTSITQSLIKDVRAFIGMSAGIAPQAVYAP